jgi:hypothetical protein
VEETVAEPPIGSTPEPVRTAAKSLKERPAEGKEPAKKSQEKKMAEDEAGSRKKKIKKLPKQE